ncbi:microsomal signal peptidase subunit [Rickenella mellea]|uniref:Signal peptidase complex subunit 1 n=1 Tax=Rickenella mellea TaxID=50990 RepID=A0A4Y7PSS8_9AGAM|nr:microsomal signal peptidase subunit [Rickenella mellea]
MQSSLQTYLEGRIDFEGQNKVEKITRIALPGITATAFFAGLATQSLRLTFSLLGLATLALALMVVPQWPMYNEHPVKWLPVKDAKKKE